MSPPVCVCSAVFVVSSHCRIHFFFCSGIFGVRDIEIPMERYKLAARFFLCLFIYVFHCGPSVGVQCPHCEFRWVFSMPHSHIFSIANVALPNVGVCFIHFFSLYF